MISVLLPTYNSAAVLSYSIRSILNQTFHDYELLILDDGSADGTESIVSQFKDVRIHYLKYPHRGLSETLNAGLRQAKYEIVARMDAGDISLPERFEKQYSCISKLPLNAIVSCRYAIFDNKRIKYLVPIANDSSKIKRRLALHSDFVHSSVMYNKNILLSLDAYRNVPLEDYDLWLRIKDSAEFYVVSEVLLLVEYTSRRLSTTNIPQKYMNQYKIQTPYYINIEKEFGIIGVNEKLILFGWREYFYGNKGKARKHWGRLGLIIFRQPRIILAWFVTFLPENIFISFKELRPKFRLWYLMHYFTRTNIQLRKQFYTLIKIKE
jgi:glycosyltransferase involved in cell wall biosynthesis